MNVKYAKDTKVILELIKGDKYVGTYQSGNENKITLINVSEYPSNSITEPIACFYKAEIVSIDEYAGSKNLHESANNETIADDLCEYISETLKLPIDKQKSDYSEWKTMCDKYIYISAIDKTFFDAIADLETYDLLAVHGLGCEFGEIILLIIGTKHQIYVFDIKLCGEDVFKNGIQFLLESDNYLKIIHDLSVLGNCLKRVYDVDIIRFMDTQLRDFVITNKSKKKYITKSEMFNGVEANYKVWQGTSRNSEENFPSTMKEDSKSDESKFRCINKKLSECLHEYLGIPRSTVVDFEITPKKMLERPLSEDVKKKACVFVAYLIPLYRAMENTFGKFSIINEMYVNSLKHQEIVTAQAIETEINSGDLPEFVKEFIKKVYS